MKERVKNVLNYKKPAFWIILVAVIAGIVLAVCFLTNPKTKKDEPIGVRVVYTDNSDNPLFFDITKSGGLTPAKAPTDSKMEIIRAHSCYIAWEDCFIPYVENGVTKNMLSKTELQYRTGGTVPVTDVRRAIFEAVAELEGYIAELLIFESHNGDDRYFVAVWLQDERNNKADAWSDVFQFHPETGKLEKLCRIENAVPIAVYPAAEDEQDAELPDVAKDASLDARIFAALQIQSSGSYLAGEYYAESHHIYGTEEQNGKTVVYALVRECWFGFVNDYFTEVSGSQCPLVFTFDGDDCEIERALDGGMFEESVKTLFPTQYADEILKHGDRYNDALWNDLTEQAKAYLKSIRRSGAVVCKTSEAGLSTLSDHGVSVEVDNLLVNMPMLADYPFYGTQEKLEDGVRYIYSTEYDATTNRIIYQKSEKGEGPARPAQEIVIDAATGEILFNYSAPVGPVEKGKDIQIDVDWIEAAKIDETVFDVDGDGVQDRCVMSYGPTSGLFTFIFTVTPEGATQPKYQNIFLTDHATLSFPVVKSDPTMLYVQAVNPMGSQEISNYVVLIEDGNIVLRGEGGDMEYLGEDGGKITLRRMQLSEQYPELFTLNAEKGLDVYVWPWGVTDGTDREPAYRCWLTESTAEQRDNWKEYRVIPDGKNGLSALSPEDIKAILAFYNLPPEQITVIPYQHPLSSYLWAQDGKIVNGNVTMADLREMLGL